MHKQVATLILNRNLPEITNKLYEHIQYFDSESTDIYVIEAGSNIGNLSKYKTWHVNTNEVMEKGLRYSRGFNFALFQLLKEGKFKKYDYFFLLTNDTVFQKDKTIEPLLKIFDKHKRLGLLSPCNKEWGELKLFGNHDTKYFWFIHNTAYLLRREFIEAIYNPTSLNYFLFDGDNFRGYGSENEIIAKGYCNDWASAITKKVSASENQKHLIEKSDLIGTDPYEVNLKLYVEEGLSWMKRKYGFSSHWDMQQYSKSTYDRFFYMHPELKSFII